MSYRKRLTRFILGFYYEFRRLNRIDRNIVVFVKYGLLYDLMFNLYRPFAVKFLTRLGGDAFHISLFNSLPGIIAVFALIPGAFFISRFTDKKKITAILFAASRVFLLFFLFTPFFPANVRPWLFVCLIGAMNFPDSVSQSSLQSYLGDVFDSRSRGLAISSRTKFGTVAVLAITLSTGLIIGLLPRTDGQIIILYQIFFALAFIAGIFEIINFLKFKPAAAAAPSPAVDTETSTIEKIKSVAKDKTFTKFLFCTVIFYVTWHAGWPLGAIIQIIDLGANEVWLALFAVANGVVAFFSAGYWNKLMIKKGSNHTLSVAAFMVAANALVIAVTPNNPLMLITFVIGGAAGIGVTVSLFNSLLESTPAQNRIFYFGVFNTLVNISLAVSPFIAHYLVTLVGSRWAMAAVGGGRFVSAAVMLLMFVVIPKMKVR